LHCSMLLCQGHNAECVHVRAKMLVFTHSGGSFFLMTCTRYHCHDILQTVFLAHCIAACSSARATMLNSCTSNGEMPGFHPNRSPPLPDEMHLLPLSDCHDVLQIFFPVHYIGACSSWPPCS
jgi:hypothetical protein